MAFTWPDGSRNHSISWAQHQTNLAQAGANSSAANAQAGQAAFNASHPAPAKGLPSPTVQYGPLPPGLGAPRGNAGPAPAAAPAVPAAPPLDPAFDAFEGSQRNTRDSTIAGLEAQKPQILADFGYTAAGYDSSGAPTGLTFDPTNPYSKAALLLRNYTQGQARTTNSMAASGQLYSGALQSSKAYNEFGYNTGSDALRKALTAALVAIANREGAARNTYETNMSTARLNRAPTS